MAAAAVCEPAQGNGLKQICQQNTAARIRHASSLNDRQHYTEAADLLEGLLLEQPDADGALEQYNRALAGLNKQYAVQSPAPVAAPPAAWKLNAGLQLRGGYSSNFNQAPSQSAALSASGLIFASSIQKQAGFAGETQLTGTAVRDFAGKLQWQLKGDIFGRETGYDGYADYRGANLLTALTRHGDKGAETGVALGVNALRYDTDAGVYLFATQLIARHTGGKGGHCKPQTGLDLVWQRQQSNTQLDSRYTGLMAGLLCDTPLGFYNAAISAGWDWADSGRPGGDQLRVKLDLSGIWPTPMLSQTSFIKAYANILRSDDRRGYSAKLEAGATRHISRINLGLDYDWPLNLIANNWRGVATVKWQNQNSNISLFTMDTLEGWLSVRVAW